MAHIISIVNQKGGVGKTTTAINLSCYLAHLEQKVLLIDLDPQANATSGLGIRAQELPSGIYEALVLDHPIEEIILGQEKDRFHILPSTSALAGAHVELIELDRREYRLADLIDHLRDNYDYIIIDCPPSLGILTLNGLVGAEELLIPVQAEYYALEGLSQLMQTISLVQNNLKPELGILGAVITMYDKRTRLSSEILKELYKYFPNKIFRSVIPRTVRLAEAPSFGQPILNYDARSKGARAYEKLAREILELHNN